MLLNVTELSLHLGNEAMFGAGWVVGFFFFFFCSLPFQSPLICNLPEGKNREGPSRMWCATLIRLSVKSLKAAHMMVKLKGIKLLLRLDLIICAAAAYWF